MNLISQILIYHEFDQSDFVTLWFWSVRFYYTVNLISQILLRCEFDQSDFDTPWIWSVRFSCATKLICQILIRSELDQSDFVTLWSWYFLFCSICKLIMGNINFKKGIWSIRFWYAMNLGVAYYCTRSLWRKGSLSWKGFKGKGKGKGRVIFLYCIPLNSYILNTRIRIKW